MNHCVHVNLAKHTLTCTTQLYETSRAHHRADSYSLISPATMKQTVNYLIIIY